MSKLIPRGPVWLVVALVLVALAIYFMIPSETERILKINPNFKLRTPTADVYVDANQMWTDTGVSVNQGDDLQMGVEGCQRPSCIAIRIGDIQFRHSHFGDSLGGYGIPLYSPGDESDGTFGSEGWRHQSTKSGEIYLGIVSALYDSNRQLVTKGMPFWAVTEARLRVLVWVRHP
jgi:hypothetical protein